VATRTWHRLSCPSTCPVGAARERDIPPAVIARDREEYNFLIDGWVSKDMPSDFTEYFDLRESASRNTGYNGQRVWRFIHTNLCFQKRLQQEEMGWKRDFNRLVSGMHAVVDCEIIEDIGLSEEGRCEYRRPLDDERGLHPPPDNSFLAQFLTPGGFATSRARFSTCTMPTCSPSPPSARCRRAPPLRVAPIWATPPSRR